jgi:hypothetical protein
MHHHHGSFTRHGTGHGYVQSKENENFRIEIRHQKAANHASGARQPTYGSRKPPSGHRHSWQEPSTDLFSVAEEIPQIIVSDYDELLDAKLSLSSSGSEELQKPGSDTHEDQIASQLPSEPHRKTDSPRLGSCEPAEKLDTQLNQMWFGERARL